MLRRALVITPLALFVLTAHLSAQSPAPSGPVELASVIDIIVTRPAQGAPRPDPAALLARLRAIDPAALSFDEQIDRRFAETILVGRTLARPQGELLGEAAYTRVLREQYLLPYDADELWAYAQTQFDGTVRDLEALAKTIDPSKTWRELIDEGKRDYPEPERMIEAHAGIVAKARAHMIEKDLMSVPWKESLEVITRQQTPGANPYYGDFSGAASRPPLADGTLHAELRINPFKPDWDEEYKRNWLLEHDWGYIYVTMPHETYGGHHVQGLYQMHNPRVLRQKQGTPLFSEGWGLYNEQLFQETGFMPTPRIHLRQVHLRLWRNARVIYDVGLQTGRMTREDAITLMTDKVGFLRWAAESEVDSALARPAYFIGYFMGMTEILKMRDEYRRLRGDAFTLKEFHDRLLSIGSMPPALVREVLLRGAQGSQRSGVAGLPGPAELEAIVDAIVTGPASGAPRPDPAALLARLRALDPASLSFDEDIDRRFAETILIGRMVAAPEGQPLGEAAYTRMLREQYLLPYDAAGLWTYAQGQFDATVRELETLAKTIDPKKTWRQIADEVKQDHPDPLKMIEAHQEVVDKARAHLIAKDLMTLPWPETCTVVRRVPTAGNNPYYGNFSGAASRPPLADGTLRGEWHINPYDPSWDEQRRRDYLVEHDWGVIYVTAPHESYGGHHVEIMYRMHNPSALRRRMSSPMFSEGWGLYNEQLFTETGFMPSETIKLRQLQLRLWRNARVIYDAGMQTGRMTREDAITLMTDKVGFLRWAAEAEVDSALARPGYFIGYYMGMSEILKMRDEYRARRGAAFTLKDFHDRLLKIGSMPPALVREALFRNLEVKN